jgi:hypothetical protein
MLTRERFLLLVTVLGFVVPNTMVVIFIAEHGVDIGHYLGDWFETLPAAQIAADLAICCLAFLAWASWDGPRSGVERWWWTLPATFLVGLCFAIPLYLLMRERRVSATAWRSPA